MLPAPATIVSRHTYRVEGETWRVTIVRESDWFTHQLRLERNGRRVLTKTVDNLLGAVVLQWPYRGRLLAVSSHTSTGHGMKTFLFRLDRRGVVNLKLTLENEIGGPIYRDVNGDGRPEILFDNYDWYTTPPGKPPTAHLAYQYDGHRLTHLKTLPAHQSLPYRLPRF